MEIPKIQPKIPNVTKNADLQKPASETTPVGFVSQDSIERETESPVFRDTDASTGTQNEQSGLKEIRPGFQNATNNFFASQLEGIQSQANDHIGGADSSVPGMTEVYDSIKDVIGRQRAAFGEMVSAVFGGAMNSGAGSSAGYGTGMFADSGSRAFDRNDAYGHSSGEDFYFNDSNNPNNWTVGHNQVTEFDWGGSLKTNITSGVKNGTFTKHEENVYTSGNYRNTDRTDEKVDADGNKTIEQEHSTQWSDENGQHSTMDYTKHTYDNEGHLTGYEGIHTETNTDNSGNTTTVETKTEQKKNEDGSWTTTTTNTTTTTDKNGKTHTKTETRTGEATEEGYAQQQYQEFKGLLDRLGMGEMHAIPTNPAGSGGGDQDPPDDSVGSVDISTVTVGSLGKDFLVGTPMPDTDSGSGGGNTTVGQGNDNPNDSFARLDQDRVGETLARHTLKNRPKNASN